MARYEVRTDGGVVVCTVGFSGGATDVRVVTNLSALNTGDRGSAARAFRVLCAEHGVELTPAEAWDRLFGR